jgi:hypothetical protein
VSLYYLLNPGGRSHCLAWVLHGQPVVDASLNPSTSAIIGDRLPVWQMDPIVDNDCPSTVNVFLSHQAFTQVVSFLCVECTSISVCTEEGWQEVAVVFDSHKSRLHKAVKGVALDRHRLGS